MGLEVLNLRLNEGADLVVRCRRLADTWRLTFRGRAFAGIAEHDLLLSIQQDHYFQIEIARFL